MLTASVFWNSQDNEAGRSSLASSSKAVPPSGNDRAQIVRGKSRSNVWGYFGAKYIGADGRAYANCKLCQNAFSACNTTNLKAHLTSVHRHTYVMDRIKDKKVCFPFFAYRQVNETAPPPGCLFFLLHTMVGRCRLIGTHVWPSK